MSTRSVSELRQAATDAGWSGEPLAEEFLAKLEELSADKVPPAASSKLPLIVAGICAALAVGLGVMLHSTSARLESLKALSAEQQKALADQQKSLVDQKAVIDRLSTLDSELASISASSQNSGEALKKTAADAQAAVAALKEEITRLEADTPAK